ncbi:MAG: efflux RND transporter permease subunit [Sphingomicrobium sp.]
MSFRNISSWCIKNPVPPIVLFIGLMLAGLLAFQSMSINNKPDIDFPAAVITISQPGAAPSEMETQVTQKIEAAIRGVTGIDEIDSSVREGTSQTFAQFKIGTPVDRAINDVRDAISQVRGDLPDGILEPRVERIDVAGEPITFVAAETNDMGLEELSWYVDNQVARRIRGVSGVASVDREGGVNREIRVTLDPSALQSQGITAAQVNAQLRQVNTNATGGRAEIAGSEQSVRVIGNAKTAYDLSQTRIAVGGRTVRLADIARVSDGYQEQRTFAKLHGQQVVSFNITRAKGTSDLSVYNAAWDEMRVIEKENPKIHFSEISNTVDYTKSQYKSSMQALVEGAILAVIVVYLFLRDGRATAISALAIPLSAIPAFWFMSLMGLTLNFMSLLALSLVAGVLVDDAIVEIENIVRHMRMGKSAYQAAMDAADEIGLAVLATTMAIVGVFLPVALMSGIAGQFFRSFGYPVVISVLMSLLVARMITPLIAAYFLKSHGSEDHASGRVMGWYMAVLRWTLLTGREQAQGSERGSRGLIATLRRDHRWWMVGVSLVALALTAVALATLPLTFQPQTNDSFSNVSIRLAPGSTLAQTEAAADRAAGIIAKDPDVERVFERIYVGVGTLNVVLKKDRKKKSYDFERAIAPQLAQIPDALVTVLAKNSGGPGGGGRDVMLFLGSEDPELLSATAEKINAEMQKLKVIRAPRVMGEQVRPEISIKPHFDLAAQLGVTTAALSQTIRIATIGEISQNSAKFSLSDRQVPITVALSQDARRDLSTLENLPVPTASGGSVPLKAVAEIGFGSGPAVVQRTNQVRRLAVGADLSPGVISGEAWKQINALPSVKNLPANVTKLTLGDQKWEAELIVSFVIALVSGVLLVFAVLVLLYRRFLSPFVNMGSLLLAPLGAAIALHIAGQPLSMPVLIGLLMLLGIVAKNSILLIDFAVEMINHGMLKDDAIIEAGHKRAQPIVMTTVAMIAGMIPVSLSLSGDGSFRAPMGITVMGGLLFSTVLTLLLVPSLFSIALDLEAWLGRRFGRLIDNGEEHRPMAAPIAPLPAE